MLTAVYNIVLIIQDKSFFYQYIAMLQRTMEEMLVLPSGILIHVTQGIYAMGPVVVVLIFVPEVLRFLGMMMLGLSVDKLQGPTRETGGLSILQAAFILEGVFYTLIDLDYRNYFSGDAGGDQNRSDERGQCDSVYDSLFGGSGSGGTHHCLYSQYEQNNTEYPCYDAGWRGQKRSFTVCDPHQSDHECSFGSGIASDFSFYRSGGNDCIRRGHRDFAVDHIGTCLV